MGTYHAVRVVAFSAIIAFTIATTARSEKDADTAVKGKEHCLTVLKVTAMPKDRVDWMYDKDGVDASPEGSRLIVTGKPGVYKITARVSSIGKGDTIDVVTTNFVVTIEPAEKKK